MVEVFKTNVYDAETADEIARHLVGLIPGGRVSFDLEDCDKILRIENESINPDKIKTFLSEKGFNCEILE